MIRTIVSIIALAGAGATFFFYTQPTYDSTRAINEQSSTYDAALSKATELQQLKQTLLARYNAFNPSDIDRLQKLLPDHVDNVRLILDFDSLAAKQGMALQDVVVSTPTVDSAAQAGSGTISASKRKYESLTLKFTTQGTYDQFQNFLADAEKSLRIVDLVSLKIAAASGSTSAQPVYSYDLTLRTYWLK